MKLTYPLFGNKWDFMFLNLELLDNDLIGCKHAYDLSVNFQGICNYIIKFDIDDKKHEYNWKYNEVNDRISFCCSKYLHKFILKNDKNLYYLHKILSVDHMTNIKKVLGNIDSWLNMTVKRAWKLGNKDIKKLINEWIFENIISEESKEYYHISKIIENVINKAENELHETWKTLFFWKIYYGSSNILHWLHNHKKIANNNICRLIFHLFNNIYIKKTKKSINIFQDMFPFYDKIYTEYCPFVNYKCKTKNILFELIAMIGKILIMQIDNQFTYTLYPYYIQEKINEYLTYGEQINKLKIFQ